MTRIERLELAVQHLSERVLGEGVRFEDIAEQVAAEQGIVRETPEVDVEAIVQEVLARVPPPAPAVPSFDPAPLLAELHALKSRLATVEAMAAEQDRLTNAIANAMAALADAAEKKLSAA